MNRKNIINGLLIFLTGAVVGSGIVYVYMKKDIDKKVKTELQPLANEFVQKIKNAEELSKKTAEENRKAKERMMNSYMDLTDALNYTEPDKKEFESEILVNDFPFSYFISSDEFGEISGYQTEFLVHYANGIVINAEEDAIQDPEKLFGSDNYKKLSKFTEEGKHTAWIRNEEINTDFEIELADYDFND